MAEPHPPTSLTDTEVAIHTAPLPGEAEVLMFFGANAPVELIARLIDALDVVTLDEDDSDPARRG